VETVDVEVPASAAMAVEGEIFHSCFVLFLRKNSFCVWDFWLGFVIFFKIIYIYIYIYVESKKKIWD
jgi:hypothetical protein